MVDETYNTTASSHIGDNYYGERNYASYIDSASTPLYPFGYGLSYTTFAWNVNSVCEKEGLNYKRFRKYLKTHVNIIEDAKEFISNEFLRDLAKKYNLYILSMSEKIHVKYYSKKFGVLNNSC